MISPIELTIGDTRVIAALAGIAQEISIACHNHASFTLDKVEVSRIVACTQTGIHRRGDVNAIPTQRSGDVGIHVLVQAVS